MKKQSKKKEETMLSAIAIEELFEFIDKTTIWRMIQHDGLYCKKVEGIKCVYLSDLVCLIFRGNYPKLRKKVSLAGAVRMPVHKAIYDNGFGDEASKELRSILIQFSQRR